MTDHHVVAVILRQADRLLLCHRAPTRRWYPDVWDFPGGHVEPEERPEEALRREILEELGVELDGVDGAPILAWTSLCGCRATGAEMSRTCSQRSTTPSGGSAASSLAGCVSLIRPTSACCKAS
jgi:hypothetical protein